MAYEEDGKIKRIALPENCKPRFVNQTERRDGSTSTVYGNERTADKKIIEEHGHSVTKDGKVAYVRTMGGRVLKNDKA